MTQISRDEPPPPSSHGLSVDSELEAACMRMLQRNAAARYSSMREVANAMDLYLERATNAVPPNGHGQRHASRRTPLAMGIVAVAAIALITSAAAGIWIKIKTTSGVAQVHITDDAMREGPVEIHVGSTDGDSAPEPAKPSRSSSKSTTGGTEKSQPVQIDDQTKSTPVGERRTLVVSQSESTQHWDQIFSEPHPLYGLRQWTPVTFDTSRPEFHIQDINVDPDRIVIRRLWFKTTDLYPSGNRFKSRDCNAWILSEVVKAIPVETTNDQSQEQVQSVRPAEPLPDGAYCLVDADPEHIDQPTRYASFVVHGLSQPSIADCHVTVNEGRATVEAWMKNDGDGALNDTRLKLILARVSEDDFVFVRRINLKGFDVPAHNKQRLQLTFDVSKELAGRYRLTVGINPTHEDADTNRIAEAHSNVFAIDN